MHRPGSQRPIAFAIHAERSCGDSSGRFDFVALDVGVLHRESPAEYGPPTYVQPPERLEPSHAGENRCARVPANPSRPRRRVRGLNPSDLRSQFGRLESGRHTRRVRRRRRDRLIGTFDGDLTLISAVRTLPPSSALRQRRFTEVSSEPTRKEPWRSALEEHFVLLSALTLAAHRDARRECEPHPSLLTFVEASLAINDVHEVVKEQRAVQVPGNRKAERQQRSTGAPRQAPGGP